MKRNVLQKMFFFFVSLDFFTYQLNFYNFFNFESSLTLHLVCLRVSNCFFPFFWLLWKLKHIAGPNVLRIATEGTFFRQSFLRVSNEISPLLVTRVLSDNLWNISKNVLLVVCPKTLMRRRKAAMSEHAPDYNFSGFFS